MTAIFLSPHFDDVALSCGGIVWEWVHQGQPVECWTVCAGYPSEGPLSPFAQSLHARWQTQGKETVDQRRKEDEEACRRMGVTARYFEIPDCIYRFLPQSHQPLVQGEADLYQPIHPEEQALVERLAQWLAEAIPVGAQLISPFALGGHVDHRLVRAAAETPLVQGRIASFSYYPDYPYVIRKTSRLEEMRSSDHRPVSIPLTGEAISAWQNAIAAYTSQISTFWKGLDEMKTAIEAYTLDGGGTQLYTPDDKK